ncbi:MAG: response regulator [Verrucomicrobia bacterium]|nr:response regulator [Verrucomicrobiota bacterium]
MSRKRILIVEDDDLHYELYQEALADYDLYRATTASAALASLPKERPDLILLDHVLARREKGLAYLPEIKDLLPYVPIIVVSGALEAHQQIDALTGPRRAHYCLTKPVDLEELKRTVATALEQCGEAEIVRQFEALERSKRVDIEELLSRSTDRLRRQTEIRTQLTGAHDRPNISALARQFRVARRTIIRDLQELIRRGELPAEVYPRNEPEEEEGGGDPGSEEPAAS